MKIVIGTAIALLAAGAVLEAQIENAPISVEQRMVAYFDNQADAAVVRVLKACDVIQTRIYAGAQVHVREELVASVMAIESEDIAKIVDKVKPDVVNAGMTVEYVVKDAASGEVLTSGIVGNEGR